MRALVVVAKAPLPGVAKTRLAAAGIGEVRAAALAKAFLRDTLEHCSRLRAERFLAYDPASAHELFRAFDPAARLLPQGEGDLGARLARIVRAVFDAGAARALVLGADVPHLQPRWLEGAFERLEGAGAVLGPAEDGGYWLIGVRAPCDALFREIPWSTPAVASTTRERAREAGLELALAERTFDVDREPDLERLRRLLAADPARAPRTAQLLLATERRRATRRRPSP
jgi:rSAM/selenodomain-associated transferase 1